MSGRQGKWGTKSMGRLGLAVAGAAALAGEAVAPARADDVTQQQLLEQIKALEAKVRQLETRQQAAPASVNVRAVDATADDVVRDANRRSQLLAAEGFTAGYSDGKFILRSGDGNFLLHPWFQFQFRSTSTFREDGKQDGTSDDFQNGFEVRRMKFGFDGNVFSPNLTYLFQWATDRKTGSPVLEAAYAQYKFADTPFAVRAGQIKNPLDHEQITSTKYSATVDRTLVNDIFANGEGFVQGVSFIYDPVQSLRGEVAITDGNRSANTNFQDYPTTGIPADFGVAGRVEYKLFGDWKEYDRITAYGEKKELLVVGAGADYTEAGDTGALTHVVDAQYGTGDGLGLYAAYLGRYTKDNVVGTAAAGDTYDWTVRAQASYVLGQKWEPFVQYEYLHFDSAGLAAGLENEVHIIRLGTSYFLYGQNARIQADVSYLPNGSPIASDGLGILQSNGKNELIFRAQLHLLL